MLFGMCLNREGRYNEAEDQPCKVFKIKQTVLGRKHLETLVIMNNLAIIYLNQGRWNKDEDLQMQVIGVRKRVLGKEHLDILYKVIPRLRWSLLTSDIDEVYNKIAGS
jgi:hypothetical protein